MVKVKYIRATVLMLFVSLTITTQSQTVVLRNNLLYDASLTPNLGLDVRLDSTWSLGVTAGYNAWDINKSKDRKWKHVLIMPELRHWNDTVFGDRSWFWGINAAWSHFNVSNPGAPIDWLYPSIKGERMQGDLVAAGASIGRSWRLNRLFRFEAEAGVDVGYVWADRYACGHCGVPLGEKKGLFLVPKLALNLVLHPKKKEEVQVILPEEPTAPVVPQLAFGILPPATVSDILASKNPVLEEYANYRPYDRTRVLRKEKGMLWVHFPLDKTTLLYDFRDNAPVLDKIVDITRQIMADSMSNVRLIQVIGLASVEGPVSHNEDLGNGRAQALRDYIKQHVPEATDALFELNGGGEAWAELRDQLNDYINDNNESTELISQLLKARDIIDNEPDPARREQQLRNLNGGRPYKFIREELLPDQRNSGYLRIYFDRMPDAKADAINQAVALMQKEQWQPAQDILNGVKDDPRSWNALGVTLFMNGQPQQALEYFRKAAANGNADARLNADRLSGYLNARTAYQADMENYKQLVNQLQSRKK